MQTFIEFIQKSDPGIEKLKKIKDLLLRVEGFHVKSFFEFEESPYLFVKFELNQLEDKKYSKLKNNNFGMRIFPVANKLVFKLQVGEKGTPIGIAKELEYEQDIEDLIEQGKTEEEAYNEILKRIPRMFKNYMKKVIDNILKDQKMVRKMIPSEDKDKNTQLGILNYVYNNNVDPSVKK